ncbi:glycoside hydrolase family 32 protein [Mucilaginibacter sp. BT774]|uniref:glycoside hydrolase family 32 protein n=1 Tax=Mucilaginibacter sp. BT774 TaxID=3062276 RepID=UPI0026744F66|nr:glycoside hydrolase family 32 protein [Mucilaginibacter sp. BT774]MDO3628002.1 glycoside hydrolase family 32 protein [Mucilaginibacter sp. BT774]
MYKKIITLCLLFVGYLCHFAKAQESVTKEYHEQYRPQVHFSPKAHWMNDPNGMVYFKGIYHLFFQYYPNGSTWGPMHWGHATTKDLVHWKELPIALYPDSLGYIFSGSAVVDSNNTSGFGKNGKSPLVAIFTSHDPKAEKAGSVNTENESLAYSLDNGVTWTKYAGNPVLKNPGIRDFRDPKVMWYAKEKKWVMTLATKDHITFYSSPDLKNWKKESEFGKEIGAHGGVWECPDLFPLTLNGKTYWVLIVNLNPGGPNGGSATQYFIGQFDGNRFSSIDDQTRWLDYGPDEYAGVTWGNTGNRRIFLGWMANWAYTQQVPTTKWRNAMTIPRELALFESNGIIYVGSTPVKELFLLLEKPVKEKASTKSKRLSGQYLMRVSANTGSDFSITLSNKSGEKLIIGYDKAKDQYFIDRAKSGRVDFAESFSKVAYAPRFSKEVNSQLLLVVDRSTVELFADGGKTVMTGVFFPSTPYDDFTLKSAKATQLTPLNPIW